MVYFGRPFQVVFVSKDETWLIYHCIRNKFCRLSSSVVRLIEVASVVIFCCKLNLLSHFDLTFGFLLTKHILIILLSACKFAMETTIIVVGCSDAVRINTTTSWYYNWCACWAGLRQLQMMCNCSCLGNEGILLRRRRRQHRKQDNRICFTREKEKLYHCESLCHDWKNVFFTTLSENGMPQKQAVGTLDVCLARPKVCPTDIIVRPHTAQHMINTTVDQFCLRKQKYGLVWIGPKFTWSADSARTNQRSQNC